MGLYLRVQRQLGLSLSDRWRLWRLARAIGIEHPTALLISVSMYDDAVRRYCAGQGWFRSRAPRVSHFTAIRKRLFPTPV